VARVLVVEDDLDVRMLVVLRLERAGHRVHGAGGAAEATTLIDDKGAPDLVVLDVNMPDVTGFELLGRIKAQIGRSDLPAIFLTGSLRRDDITTGRNLGALYLTKPFVASSLMDAVDALLAAHDDADEVGSARHW
jgi:DNA-binding response OmpR family regulator